MSLAGFLHFSRKDKLREYYSINKSGFIIEYPLTVRKQITDRCEISTALTFTTVAGITDRLCHDDGVINMAVCINAEMTENIVENLLLHHTAMQCYFTSQNNKSHNKMVNHNFQLLPQNAMLA